MTTETADTAEISKWLRIRIWKKRSILPESTLAPRSLAIRGVRTLIFLAQIQSCFVNFESESAADPVPNRRNQSDSCLTQVSSEISD